MVASYSSAQCVIYDLETAAPVVTLDSAKTYSKYACDSLSSQSLRLIYVSGGFQMFSCDSVVPFSANICRSVSRDSEVPFIVHRRNLKTEASR